MTKLVYLTVDGRMKVENTTIQSRMIEMADGYHPVTNDSVWQDSKRQRPGLVILVQGVLKPYGGHMVEEDVLSLLYEIDVAEKAFKPQSVSRMWMRWFSQAGAWLMRYMPILFFAGIAVWAISSTFLGGM